MRVNLRYILKKETWCFIKPFTAASSACKVYTWKPAMHAKHTSGNQQCMQSIDLETSSACSIHLETSIACKVYAWEPAVHSKYTPGNQQCIQSIRLETSSACKVYAWKLAVHAKYTPGNQQCMQNICLEISSAEACCSSRTSCAWVPHCRSLPTYFKLVCLLNNSCSFIHRYISWIEYEMGGLFLD